ncbi:MAG: hypothetical protein GXX87_05320 [Euryarchaeota archaeon]|nr:hypothetical protein [Euryarchaeota archaeon]
MPDRIVVMGAGGLSLGFFGPELSSQYAITFLDVSVKSDLIERIRKSHAYTTNLAGKTIETIRVKGVDAFRIDDPAQDADVRRHVAQAQIFYTAVGIRNLDKAMIYLTERMQGRKDPIYVLCAENGEGVTEAWRQKTTDNLNILDTVMGRMCRLEDRPGTDYAPVEPDLGWAVVGEAFYGMPLIDTYRNPKVFHSDAFHFVPEAEFHARDRIKLFAHNGLHCFIAVQGSLRGVERFSDMAGDAEVEGGARALLDKEIAPALWKECGPHVDRKYLEGYFAALPGRLLSPTLRDHVARGVRGLADKFAPNERIVGGLKLLLRNGVRPDLFLDFIADGLRVVKQDAGEAEATAILERIDDLAIRKEVKRRYEARK